MQQYNFSKKRKVSVWASQHPYQDVPDSYFEERFSHKNKRANNTWSDNFKLTYFYPDKMETNGSQDGSIAIKQAAGECSYSSSYMEVLMSKARKKKLEQVTWIVMLFEYEYSPKIAEVESDEYLTFLGAFSYDEMSSSLFEPAE